MQVNWWTIRKTKGGSLSEQKVERREEELGWLSVRPTNQLALAREKTLGEDLNTSIKRIKVEIPNDR